MIETGRMAGLIAALALGSASAIAQEYPSRPVRLITTAPAGGTPDVMVRMVTPALSAIFDQQLVIDNRPGAGGRIGVEVASRVFPDGYTLLVGTPGPLTVLPHVQSKVGYDALKDFAPIGLLSMGPFLLIAHPAVPARSVKELIALARAQPGKLNYASAGNGSTNHLTMEYFKSVTGVNFTHVPYKGAPTGITDLIAGQMQLMFNSIPPVLPHIKSERLRLLGVASTRRFSGLPDAPTIAEAGVPGFEAGTWVGLLAPAHTPAQIVSRWNGALGKVIQGTDIRSQFETQGAEPVGGSAKEFSVFIAKEFEKHAKIVKLAGARVD